MIDSQYEISKGIGERLRAYRLGRALSPDEVAEGTGLSRAAIYRYEAGQPVRSDVLGLLADFLGVSVASLFGVGSEFISSAQKFFERMHQIEAICDQITILFGPISFLLTTDEFDRLQRQVLLESVPRLAPNQGSLGTEIENLLGVLAARKATYKKRRPNIVSLVSSAELERLLKTGIIGCDGLDASVLDDRRRAAAIEVENILRLLRDQPMGVQIGLVEDSLPGASFQLLRSSAGWQVSQSPFRLGLYANIRVGVGTVTSARESVDMHKAVSDVLWQNSRKGQEAFDRVQTILKACGR